jgi:hypothetical protein
MIVYYFAENVPLALLLMASRDGELAVSIRLRIILAQLFSSLLFFISVSFFSAAPVSAILNNDDFPV